jgi:hypothetical protein
VGTRGVLITTLAMPRGGMATKKQQATNKPKALKSTVVTAPVAPLRLPPEAPSGMDAAFSVYQVDLTRFARESDRSAAWHALTGLLLSTTAIGAAYAFVIHVSSWLPFGLALSIATPSVYFFREARWFHQNAQHFRALLSVVQTTIVISEKQVGESDDVKKCTITQVLNTTRFHAERATKEQKQLRANLIDFGHRSS